MGISGLFKELGPGQRISLAKLSADHYTAHSRPFRLAIDISIWLFQIQSGKGGSNPALRTFYYRLLRLLTLNIHPLFVFDGPNKPEWKRGKKVGGPGVRVASVPEFLAKQLLKQFGFPWHVAPGEAEAECALLQREGIVNAVLSEDVDTLMFGSGITLRNWTAEGSTKSPTHVTVYREGETKEKSGLDSQGMILVALMSGGDYIPTGIAGCGPKLASDAARAGFASRLCKLKRRDTEGLKSWREDLMHDVRTNASKHFSRKNGNFTIPEDFPNWEVLGYYTHPCVSSAEKIRQMKESVKWDQPIDFAALRSFTADAFDWRCIGGAKKFIKNLAPAMLVRELRLQSTRLEAPKQITQEERELALVHAIHGKRNHSSTDGELEYRITFTPADLVSIDLSIEEEDDQFNPAGANGIDSDAESDFMTIPSSTPAPDEPESAPASPTKKRTFKPYHPDQPEKLWLLRSFLQLGCPLLVETYEAPIEDPKEFLKARRKTRAVTKGGGNIHATAKSTKAKKARAGPGQENALMQYARVTKAKESDREALKELDPVSKSNCSSQDPEAEKAAAEHDVDDVVAAFRLPSTQLPAPPTRRTKSALPSTQPVPRPSSGQCVPPARPFAPFTIASSQPAPTRKHDASQQRTPRKSKKRRSPDLSSPAASQRTITSYYSPSPRRVRAVNWVAETIDLVSSSPFRELTERPQSPSPGNTRHKFSRTSLWQPAAEVESEGELELPSSVTKRRKRGPLKRAHTAPAGPELDGEDVDAPLPIPTSELDLGGDSVRQAAGEVVEIGSSSPMKDVPPFGNDEVEEDELPSQDQFFTARMTLDTGGGFLLEDDLDATPKASRHGHAEHGPRPSESRVTDWLQDWDPEQPPRMQHSLTSPPEEGPPSPPQPALPSISRAQQAAKPKASSRPTSARSKEPRRSPRQHRRPSKDTLSPQPQKEQHIKPKKKLILPRTSLAGAWKEVAADSVEALDLTGDGSGWKASGGRAELVGQAKSEARGGVRGFRKSGVEVLDLTGA